MRICSSKCTHLWANTVLHPSQILTAHGILVISSSLPCPQAARVHLTGNRCVTAHLLMNKCACKVIKFACKWILGVRNRSQCTENMKQYIHYIRQNSHIVFFENSQHEYFVLRQLIIVNNKKCAIIIFKLFIRRQKHYTFFTVILFSKVCFDISHVKSITSFVTLLIRVIVEANY